MLEVLDSESCAGNRLERFHLIHFFNANRFSPSNPSWNEISDKGAELNWTNKKGSWQAPILC